MMIIENKFEIGETLYLVTDEEQNKRLCTAIVICPDNSLLYEVISGTSASKHYEFELSREPDIAMKTR